MSGSQSRSPYFGRAKRGEAWERGWAITGIVFGLFLNVILGLLALRAYRRWQRGERERPTGLIVFGIVVTALIIPGSILLGISEPYVAP
jgi:hypothetical protein